MGPSDSVLRTPSDDGGEVLDRERTARIRPRVGPPPVSPVDPSHPQHEAWLFLRPKAVPERWRRRSLEVRMVPLLPEEAARVLAEETTTPEAGPEDEPLIKLLARGLSARAIAVELGMPLRTVERRLARLRERFGARSTAELAAFLSKRGFS